MSLKDFTHTQTIIPLPGGHEFKVRGISLNDVALIFRWHEDAVQEIYVKLQANANLGLNDPASVVDVIREIIQVTPGLVGSLIALAADEAGEVMTVNSLPLPIQIEALTAIGQLTFQDLDGAKKFAASVIGLLNRIAPMTEDRLAMMKTATNGTIGQDSSIGA